MVLICGWLVKPDGGFLMKYCGIVPKKINEEQFGLGRTTIDDSDLPESILAV